MNRSWTLPEAATPMGAYERARIHAGVGFLSGQFPLREGKMLYTGRIGADVSEAEGTECAQVAALNAIAAIQAVLGGDLTRLATLLRVDGYVASVDGFVQQPRILDGASTVFREVLGLKGHHARSAVGVPRLPFDAPIELLVTFGVTG